MAIRDQKRHAQIHSHGRRGTQNRSNRKKGKETCLYKTRKGQAGGARQTLMHAHAGYVALISAAHTAPTPTQCLMQNRHLVNVCSLNGN